MLVCLNELPVQFKANLTFSLLCQCDVLVRLYKDVK
jgi:hypothetical protein